MKQKNNQQRNTGVGSPSYMRLPRASYCWLKTDPTIEETNKSVYMKRKEKKKTVTKTQWNRLNIINTKTNHPIVLFKTPDIVPK